MIRKLELMGHIGYCKAEDCTGKTGNIEMGTKRVPQAGTMVKLWVWCEDQEIEEVLKVVAHNRKNAVVTIETR
jgi:hypothetical protein